MSARGGRVGALGAVGAFVRETVEHDAFDELFLVAQVLFELVKADAVVA